MDDLIYRAVAIARIDKCVALSGIGLEPVMAVRDVKALISVLPTIPAIPVEWLKGLMLSTEDDTDKAEYDWIMREWESEQKEQEAR